LDVLQSARQRPVRGEGPALAGRRGGEALAERQEREVENLRRGQQERVEEVVREHEEVVREHAERLAHLLAEHEAAEGDLVARHAEERRAGQDDWLGAPECPVCLERMAPPTQIFQCRNGHLVCGACRPGLQPPICPECRADLTGMGRATAMEQFLRTIFRDN